MHLYIYQFTHLLTYIIINSSIHEHIYSLIHPFMNVSVLNNLIECELRRYLEFTLFKQPDIILLNHMSIYVQTIYKQYTNTIQTIYKQYTNNIQTIYKQYTNNIHTIYKQYTNNIQTIYKQYTNNIQTIYKQYLHIYIYISIYILILLSIYQSILPISLSIYLLHLLPCHPCDQDQSYPLPQLPPPSSPRPHHVLNQSIWNQTKFFKLEQTKYLKLNQTNYFKHNQTKYFKLNQTKYFQLNQTKYFKLNQTKYFKLDQTKYFKLNQTKFLKLNQTKYFKLNQTKYFKLNQTKYFKLNQTKYFKLDQTKYFKLNQTKYFKLNQTNCKFKMYLPRALNSSKWAELNSLIQIKQQSLTQKLGDFLPNIFIDNILSIKESIYSRILFLIKNEEKKSEQKT